MTRVVNVHKDPYDIYIGRPSKWGNPFRMQTGISRAQAVALHREWWYAPEQEKLREAALVELKDKVLACHCHPLACHGHTIAEFINRGTPSVSEPPLSDQKA